MPAIAHRVRNWPGHLVANRVLITLALVSLAVLGSANAGGQACPSTSANYPCAYVSTASGISVVNLATKAVQPTQITALNPTTLTVSPDNSYLWAVTVSASENGEIVSPIITSTGLAGAQVTGQGGLFSSGVTSGLPITAAGRYLYVPAPVNGAGTLEYIDSSTMTAKFLQASAINSFTPFFGLNGGSIANGNVYFADACEPVSVDTAPIVACISAVSTTSNTLTAVLPLSGTAYTQLASTSGGITATGIFVPQGQTIAYVGLAVSRLGPGPGGPTTELATVDLNSGNVENLTIVQDSYGNFILDLIGLPDGSEIYLSTDTISNPFFTAYAVNTATGAITTMLPTGASPSASSGDLALSPDGKTLYLANGSGIDEYNTQTNAFITTIPLSGAQDIAIMHALPIPLINQPLSPNAAAVGSGAFTLTVNGSQFAPGAVVKWNGNALATTYKSAIQLTATVSAAHLAVGGTASISVINPGPNEIASNAAYFSITSPTANLTFGSFTITVGTQPELLLTGDLNKDGIPDVVAVTGCGAVTSCSSGKVSVLIGSASGLSAPGTGVNLGAVPSAAVVGDFNGDGNLDVATLNNGGELASLSYLQGNGTGNLVLKSTSTLSIGGGSSLEMAKGDFNHDGRQDLIVVNPNNGAYSVLLGQGDGTFSELPEIFPYTETNFGPVAVLTGDFNGDGLVDTAIVGEYADLAAIVVLQGNGDGTFGSPIIGAQLTESPVAFTSGDFNGDKIPDLAVAANSGAVLLFIGNGDGTFASSEGSVNAGGTIAAIGTADLNGDNKLDLLTAESGTPGSALTFLGAGDATFGTALTQAVGTQPQSIAIADFNNDGRLDVATGNSDGTVSVLLQNGVPFLDKNALAFAEEYDGTTSASMTVTLTNTGSAALLAGPASITGTNASQFTIVGGTCSSTGSTSLPAGNNCTVQVAFAPTVSGDATAALSFGLSQTGTTVALTGTGVSVTITTQPQSQTIGVNGTATLHVVASGLAGLSYQWYQGQSGDTTRPINGTNSATFTTGPLTATTSYWVQVSATSAGTPTGSELARSNTARITVVSQPTITTQPQSQSIAVNSTAVLTVAATSNSTLSYQWYIGASGDKTNPVPGATSATYTTPALTATTSYWVLVSAAVPGASAETAASNTATITVVAAPVITVQPQSKSVVLNGTAQLSVTATSNSTLSYQWYAGASGNTSNLIPGATAATYTTPALTATASYWVLVKAATDSASGAETTASNTAVVTVIPPPTITGQPQSQSIGVNQTAVLTITATDNAPLSYQWYVGISGDKTNPIPGATGATYTTPALTATTNYWVLVSVAAQLPGGPETTASNTAIVAVVPAPVITAQPQSQTIYYTQPPVALSVTATSPNTLTYQWYLGASGDESSPAPGNATSSTYLPTSPTTTTSYWVLITDSIGNTVQSAAAVITVLPHITTQPIGVQIAPGGTATLAVAIASGEPGVSYQWYESTGGAAGSAIDGATDTTYTTSALATTTTYWVAVSNASGTVNSDPAVVTVGAVFPGQSVSLGLVIPNNIQAPLNSTITLSCTQVTYNGGPAVPLAQYKLSCDLSPQTLTNSNIAQPITVTLGTSSGSTTSANSQAQRPASYGGFGLPVAGITLLGLGLFVPGKYRKRFGRFFVLVLLAVVVTGLMSCGGHFTTTTTVTGTTTNATPAGAYAVIITATDSQAPSAFQQTSLIVPLTVSPTSN